MTCARNIMAAEKTVKRKRIERAANALRKNMFVEENSNYREGPQDGIREMLVSQIDSEKSS